MIKGKTLSETCFEEFLSANNLQFEFVPTADTPRPDCFVITQTSRVFFEIKELTKDDKFDVGVHHLRTRTVGKHIRSKISQARRQVKFGAEQGAPSVLLLYNALDPLQLFGTEKHDFLMAMHGEWTLEFSASTGCVLASGHGRNGSFREGHNTSFSALGHLALVGIRPTVRLYKNVYA